MLGVRTSSSARMLKANAKIHENREQSRVVVARDADEDVLVPGTARPPKLKADFLGKAG